MADRYGNGPTAQGAADCLQSNESVYESGACGTFCRLLLLRDGQATGPRVRGGWAVAGGPKCVQSLLSE